MGYFCWGNKKSLQMNNYSDDEVHKMLHDFKNRHYTAQSMTLVVQSQETIETLGISSYMLYDKCYLYINILF